MVTRGAQRGPQPSRMEPDARLCVPLRSLVNYWAIRRPVYCL
jgi:hypothetical protein